MALSPTTIHVGPDDWTQLTNANVTNTITFNNRGQANLLVMGTTSATAPTSEDGALEYPEYSGEAAVALADLFPGISAVRLYAKAIGPSYCRVSVSHD